MLFLLMVTAFALASCIKEDLSQCGTSTSYKLKIKASDADNIDITHTDAVKEVKLYVFDDSRNYLETHNATIGEVVELNYPSHDKLHVVAWGNTANDNQRIPNLNPGEHFNTAFVSLHKTKATIPIAQSPDDLFHEDIELIKENITEVEDITIRRKTSSVIITARKLKEFASTTDNNFSYRLRETRDKLDFYGKLNGNNVHYCPDAAFDNNELFVSSIFNILPATSNIEIDIYHGSVLKAIIVADGDGKPFKAVEGKLLNVLINFEANISVEVTVTDWGKKHIWKEF